MPREDRMRTERLQNRRANAGHPTQLLQRAEWPARFALRHDPSGEDRPDARQSRKILQAHPINIDLLKPAKRSSEPRSSSGHRVPLRVNSGGHLIRHTAGSRRSLRHETHQESGSGESE